MGEKKKVIRSTAKLTTLDDFLGKKVSATSSRPSHQGSPRVADRQAMKEKNISRHLAQRMKTCRSKIGRLLDPKDGNVTLQHFQRAARIVGRSLRLELV